MKEGSFIEKFQIVEAEKKEKEEGYEKVIELKNNLYNSILEQRPEMKGIHSILRPHEEKARDYGQELIAAQPDLSSEQKVAAQLAIMLHDCGKLGFDPQAEVPQEIREKVENGMGLLLSHHQVGQVNAERILKQIQDQGIKIEGVEITNALINKVKQAIDRHMNHPWLEVEIAKKGSQYPEPEDVVDKIVFEADMLSNVGFKSVGFRIGSELFMSQDAERAEKMSQEENRKVALLEASFLDVMEGVRKIEKKIKTKTGKSKIGELIKTTEEIFEYFKENSIFEQIQKDFSDQEGNFSIKTMQEKFGGDYLKQIKGRLDREIEKAAATKSVNKEILDKIKIG
ncbi:MAG: hypothetical protein ABIF84_01810 [Patescibacteria group bacterium]